MFARISSMVVSLTGISTFQMARLEERGERLGVSKLVMMENAGAGIARLLYERYRESNPKVTRVLIIAGTGNNGGDAFVAARHLMYWKYRVKVILLGGEEKIHSPEALTNWKIVKGIRQIGRAVIKNEADLPTLDRDLRRARILIISIFGTGFKGKPRRLQLRAISLINKTHNVFKLSVDIPSGMDADNGNSTYSVTSDATVTMHAMKNGMRSPSARQKCGEILVQNIGLPF
ncbi:MAG TPA: NAD(P)H-hydrate epimerase [Nitrososphaerales archaeon]|nr:NAD(P)H-hydrate epimerase [Nitrososphaerales archaeon]